MKIQPSFLLIFYCMVGIHLVFVKRMCRSNNENVVMFIFWLNFIGHKIVKKTVDRCLKYFHFSSIDPSGSFGRKNFNARLNSRKLHSFRRFRGWELYQMK
jgi:hypothetical protein